MSHTLVPHLFNEDCTRIRDLGFTSSHHVTMYGEHFELTSDPFEEGQYMSVKARSGSDPAIRTVHLPVALLLGLAYRFRKS